MRNQSPYIKGWRCSVLITTWSDISWPPLSNLLTEYIRHYIFCILLLLLLLLHVNDMLVDEETKSITNVIKELLYTKHCLKSFHRSICIKYVWNLPDYHSAMHGILPLGVSQTHYAN